MKIQLTADGTSTIYLEELDEHYHSVNGAVQESMHVYVNAGFNQCFKDSITVLEIGFGTGLNALLTALESSARKVNVIYIALEKSPLADEIIRQLNYSELNAKLFEKIHDVKWGEQQTVSPYFSLQKIETDFLTYSFQDKYDVVYYDAFAPDKQKDAWSQAMFDKIYASLNPKGILTTYCAKGEIRRMMQRSGFFVARIPGPPGKREMLQARKINLPDKHRKKE